MFIYFFFLRESEREISTKENTELNYIINLRDLDLIVKYNIMNYNLNHLLTYFS